MSDDNKNNVVKAGLAGAAIGAAAGAAAVALNDEETREQLKKKAQEMRGELDVLMEKANTVKDENMDKLRRALEELKTGLNNAKKEFDKSAQE